MERFDGRPIKPNHFESDERTPASFDEKRFRHESWSRTCALVRNHCSIYARILNRRELAPEKATHRRAPPIFGFDNRWRRRRLARGRPIARRGKISSRTDTAHPRHGRASGDARRGWIRHRSSGCVELEPSSDRIWRKHQRGRDIGRVWISLGGTARPGGPRRRGGKFHSISAPGAHDDSRRMRAAPSGRMGCVSNSIRREGQGADHASRKRRGRRRDSGRIRRSIPGAIKVDPLASGNEMVGRDSVEPSGAELVRSFSGSTESRPTNRISA